jgi:hypothetical protein
VIKANERKIYEIIEDKYEASNGRTATKAVWDQLLANAGITPFHCDDKEGVIEELMGVINEWKDCVVCADPWLNDEEHYGDGDGFLLVPNEVATKMLVLGFV